MQQFDIFISHATEDREHALRLEQAIQFKYRCFVASDDLNASLGTKQWSEAIEALLASVPVLVLLVTKRSLQSNWVKFEWRSFHEDILSERRAGLIVPILWEELDVDQLPAAIRYWQIVDFAKAGESEGIADVVEQIEGFRRASLGSDSPLFRRLVWSPSDRPSTVAPPVVHQPSRISLAAGRTRKLMAAVIGVAAVTIAATFTLVRRFVATPPPQQEIVGIAPGVSAGPAPFSPPSAAASEPVPSSSKALEPSKPPATQPSSNTPSPVVKTHKTPPRIPAGIAPPGSPPASPPVSQSPVRSNPDCNPSYTINEQGQKIFKPGCF